MNPSIEKNLTPRTSEALFSAISPFAILSES